MNREVADLIAWRDSQGLSSNNLLVGRLLNDNFYLPGCNWKMTKVLCHQATFNIVLKHGNNNKEMEIVEYQTFNSGDIIKNQYFGALHWAVKGGVIVPYLERTIDSEWDY